MLRRCVRVENHIRRLEALTRAGQGKREKWLITKRLVEFAMTHFSFGYIDTSVDPLSAVEYGVRAEKTGFHVLWMPDHFADINGDKLEPWTILAVVGAKTKKIKLGSSVTDTQRSHPARTAQCVACLDAMSRGRAILGIGAGEAMNIIPFGLPWDSPDELAS